MVLDHFGRPGVSIGQTELPTKLLFDRIFCHSKRPGSAMLVRIRVSKASIQIYEFAFLSRLGQADVQSDLFYDYRTNVASYPMWQAWLKEHHPPTLVVWGRYDPSFQVAEAEAYRRDLPDAEIHILDAGHFALDDKPDEIAGSFVAFLVGHSTRARRATLSAPAENRAARSAVPS
jgi:pimeloyl-ACP methyl ester carboxylesterase